MFKNTLEKNIKFWIHPVDDNLEFIYNYIERARRAIDALSQMRKLGLNIHFVLLFVC
jgi:hypothetical protein